MPPLGRTPIAALIRLALQEDAAFVDVTSRSVLPSAVRIRARIIAKSNGVIAGALYAAQVFRTLDPTIRCHLAHRDGQAIAAGQTILTVDGRACSIFAAERTALNLLGHLSGIATLTRAYIDRVRGTRCAMFDTRKTLPGLRDVQKYAVRMGGGQNHRRDLREAILIKTNHLRALQRGKGLRVTGDGTLQLAVAQAKRLKPKRLVEIEVTDVEQFQQALSAQPDIILLDNWRLADIRRAVRLRNSSPHTPHPTPSLEVSGGVTLANVRAIASTGVDRISVGRLTHSAPALDVSLQVT